jgi:EmrB/QacA subfamily drug resistance transporter
MPGEPTTLRHTSARQHTRRYFPTRLPSGRFLAAIIVIGSVQLMVSMYGTAVFVALPKIQNELGLSNAGRNLVLTANALTFGALLLLGGRVGDTIGRKRAFIVAIALFTAASAIAGLAWDGVVLVLARLLQGVAAAILVPTCFALVATTFPKGPWRNAATAAFSATAGLGSVMGLVVGGALTEVSWRLAFLVNVPIGLAVLYVSRTTLRETQKERMKLDNTGAVLAVLACSAVVFGVSMAPEKSWVSAITIGSGVVALVAFVAFVVVERTAENPIVPLSLFVDRNRLALYAAMFLAGGAMFTLAVVVALYVQDIMGYSPLRAGISFIPFVIATAIGVGAASRLVSWCPPRVVVIAGTILLLGAILYGTALNRGVPYFPNLAVPLVFGAMGLGMINVPLTLSLMASVGADRIGPASAVAVMLQNLGKPFVLAVIQAAVTARTLHLGGIRGPVKSMNAAQLNALDQGFAYGLLWLAGVVVLLGGVVLLIGHTAQQVGQAQQVKKAVGDEEL